MNFMPNNSGPNLKRVLLPRFFSDSLKPKIIAVAETGVQTWYPVTCVVGMRAHIISHNISTELNQLGAHRFVLPRQFTQHVCVGASSPDI